MQGIWIKNQAKNILCICDFIWVNNGANDDEWVISGFTTGESDKKEYLGFYKSKEKAYKVFNDIQEHIKQCNNWNIGRLKDPDYHPIFMDASSPIFEMPTDEEVE